MDNDIAGIPQALQNSGRPVNAIRATRLKGNEGRLCGNPVGKQVDLSARTVIGYPSLQLDDVRVPKSIATNLTHPESGMYRS